MRDTRLKLPVLFMMLATAVMPVAARSNVRTGGDGTAIPIQGLLKGKQAPVGRQAAFAARFEAVATGRQVSSGSIGLGRDPDLGTILWTANGNANTVSIVVLDEFGTTPVFDTFALSTGAGTEPTNIAVASDGIRAWVTLRGAGLVLPIFIDKVRGLVRFGRSIPVGAEPYGIILDTLQRNLYVANSTEGTVSVIDLGTGRVAARVFLGEGSWPFALALKSGLSGPSGQGGEKIYVTSFFSRAAKFNNGGETDDSRTGRVFVINGRKLAGTVNLKPFRCFPFPAGSGQKIFGFPNMLNSIAIRGRFGYVVSIGASPQRPVNFVANTQAFVQTFNTETDTEIDAGAINLNEPVEEENPKGLFFNTPWGIALSSTSNTGLVLSAASNLTVKLSTDASTGVPTIRGPAFAGSAVGIRRIPVGKNPRGVIFSTDGNLAYVHNYISRELSVVGLTAERVVRTIRLSPAPTSARDVQLLHGEELYNTSLGESTVDPNALNKGRRMSTNGWGSCFSCHPFGWTDTVVWNFPDGPRKTLPTIGRALAHPRDPGDVRMLNWSAVRDEVEDFEQNIRKVSSKFVATAQADDGKTGLMIGVSGSPTSPLGPQDIFDMIRGDGKPAKANAGRSRDWNDLAAYMRSVRAPLSPIRTTDARVSSGARVFGEVGCLECHGGAKWTSSRRPHDPAKLTQADADRIKASAGQIVDVLRKVDSHIATEETAVVVNNVPNPAKGAAGFNPPSLLGFWAFAPYSHNGKFKTIGELLRTPMVAGGRAHLLASEDARRRTAAERLLANPVAMANLELFLRSIDDRTGIRPLARRPTPPPAQPTSTSSAQSRRAGELSASGDGAAAGTTGSAPGLEAGGRARFRPSGVAERKYRTISIGDGFQTVKARDDLGSSGQGAAAGATVRGVVFARAPGSRPEGPFNPTGDGRTTVTLTGLQTRIAYSARDRALSRDATGVESNFRVDSLPAGSYQVTVTRAGTAARTSSLPLVLERGQVADLDVFLEPAL